MRVETILQAQATECGVAALAMLLTHFGRYVPLEELRQVTGVSRDGSNAKIMIAAARHYGVELKPVLVEPHELARRGLPAIVHLNFGHFVVVEAVDDLWVQVNDPCGGRRKLTVEEFDSQFTGVALVGKVMPHSEPVGKPVSLWQLVQKRCAPFKWRLLVGVLMGVLSSVVVVMGIGFFQRGIDALLDHQMMLSSGDFFVLLGGGCVVAWRFWVGFIRIEHDMAWQETQRLLRHIIRLPHAFFSYRFPGGLHGTVFDCRDLARQLAVVATRVVGTLGRLILLGGMFAYYPPIAGLVLVLCLVQVGLVVAMRQRAELLTTASTADAMGSGYAAHVINRIEALKTGGMDVEYMAQASGNMAHGVSVQQRRVMWDACEQFVEKGVQALALLGVLVWGAMAWSWGDLTVGGVAALVLLSVWGLEGVRGIGVMVGDVRKLRDLLMGIDDVHEATAENDGAMEDASLWVDDRPKAVGVALQDVTFGYSHARPAQLHGVNLVIPAGQIIGICGPSGGGKSTIVGAIAGLHRPWSGSVMVDGHDLLSLSSDALARTVALVDKTIFLFDGTVRDNLRLWDDTVSDETLWEAVRDAGLEDVLEKRGEGLDCRVMERGLNFSGGQRQRFEIARALARTPSLLILDEANDALEITLEAQIMDNLRRRGCTVVMITHREETLRHCDALVQVEDGQIVSSLTSPEAVDLADVQAADQGHRAGMQGEEGASVSLEMDKTALTEVFACVAGEMGVTVSDGVSLNASGVTAIYELARRHNVLVRRLLLQERVWWRRDCGPLIAFWGENKQPVALLPVTGGGYWMYDPVTGKKQKLTQDLALGLDDKVFTVHGRLTDGPQTPRGLFRFSFSRLGLDGVSVVLTGMMAMVLAWVWPVLGGRLFSADVSLMLAAVILFLAGLSGGLLVMVAHLTQSRLFARAEHAATTAFWDRVVRLSVAFVRKDRAESLGQVANSLSAWFVFLKTVVREGWFVLPALVYVFVLWGVDAMLALDVVGMLLLGVLCSAFFTERICKLESLRFERAVQTSTFLFDLLRGLRRLRATSSRLKTVEKWETMMQDRVAVERRIARFTNLKHVASDMMPLLGMAGFIVWLHFEVVVTPGQMIAVSVCVMGLVMAMRSFSEMLNAWVMGKPQTERMTPVLAQPTESFALSQGESGVQYDKVLAGAISVRNATFRYSAHAKPALLDVSLEISAGKITVISGPSGCGKSTLLRVLLGYLVPQQGEVCYDDVALGNWHLDVLRGQIGAVLQEDALWEGILRNNISGMAPFTLEEVWASLQLVDLDKDVDKMPRKVNTFAGEATLSTGQIQRLVMARQLIRKPRVLILDEATSALDEATEARVFANLRALNITCVCVAHRESTLSHADRVYRIQDGRIVDCDM